jgi:hypothetical protein
MWHVPRSLRSFAALRRLRMTDLCGKPGCHSADRQLTTDNLPSDVAHMIA